MASYSVLPYYLVETLPSSDRKMIDMQKTEAYDRNSKYDDEDHVVLRVASCIGSGGESTTEIRISMGETASSTCCFSTSGGQQQTRLDAECGVESLTSYYLFYLVGATSVFIPFITGQGALHMLPWLLNLSGFFSMLQYACVHKASGSTAIFFLATLHLTTGVWMLSKPTLGETAVTSLIEVWFLIHGTLKLWISLQVRKLTTWPALFVSGLLSILLACVLHHFPSKLGLSPVDIYIRAELLITGCAGALLLYSIVAIVFNRKPWK